MIQARRFELRLLFPFRPFLWLPRQQIKLKKKTHNHILLRMVRHKERSVSHQQNRGLAINLANAHVEDQRVSAGVGLLSSLLTAIVNYIEEVCGMICTCSIWMLPLEKTKENKNKQTNKTDPCTRALAHDLPVSPGLHNLSSKGFFLFLFLFLFCFAFCFLVLFCFFKVYFRSQILECSSIGEW